MDITQYTVSFVLWWLVIAALLVALKTFRLADISPVWLLAAFAAKLCYFVAIFLGAGLIPLEPVFGELQFNWSGKIVSVGATLVMVAALLIVSRRMTPAALGLTLKQNEGSVVPALIATALMTAGLIGVQLLAGDGGDPSTERLLYQATMPGVDEELFFRGLFLALMVAAAPSRDYRLLGAPINVGGLLVTLMFGLGHSLFWNGESLAFDPAIFIITGALGFGLLWIRMRTGSVVIAILAHNVINFAASFF